MSKIDQWFLECRRKQGAYENTEKNRKVQLHEVRGGNKTVFESSKLQCITLRLVQSQPNQLISLTKIFLFRIVVFL